MYIHICFCVTYILYICTYNCRSTYIIVYVFTTSTIYMDYQLYIYLTVIISIDLYAIHLSKYKYIRINLSKYIANCLVYVMSTYLPINRVFLCRFTFSFGLYSLNEDKSEDFQRDVHSSLKITTLKNMNI